jgi:hypothetical protein
MGVRVSVGVAGVACAVLALAVALASGTAGQPPAASAGLVGVTASGSSPVAARGWAATGGWAATRVEAATGGSAAVPVEVAVLTAWDRRRAAAYARADPAALRRLYRAGSRTGAADLAMLAAWTRRGLRVRALRTQLPAYVVGARRSGRFQVIVTERLLRAVAIRPRRCARCPRLRVRLPGGRP